MIELGSATQHEMVLAFLVAEVDSPRFKEPLDIQWRRAAVTKGKPQLWTE